jgi:hypothetical protein
LGSLGCSPSETETSTTPSASLLATRDVSKLFGIYGGINFTCIFLFVVRRHGVVKYTVY